MKIGAFEELVLLAVGGLSDSAYAVNVQQQIETVGEREASIGAVYAALDRLEKKGFVSSRMGPVTHEQGGKKKRFYRLTGSGEAALSMAARTRARLVAGLNTSLRPDLGTSS